MRCPIFALALSVSVLVSRPVAAEVAAISENGFASHHEVEIAAAPQVAWEAMLHPGSWWSGEHSYSGDAANMTLEPVAGGCFCETIPASEGVAAGRVEHMRVVYFDPRARTLRLVGALGPLQPEALTGVLTMKVEDAASGSRITWDYVVGGYMRSPAERIAPGVDRVIGEQLARLAMYLKKD